MIHHRIPSFFQRRTIAITAALVAAVGLIITPLVIDRSAQAAMDVASSTTPRATEHAEQAAKRDAALATISIGTDTKARAIEAGLPTDEVETAILRHAEAIIGATARPSTINRVAAEARSELTTIAQRSDAAIAQLAAIRAADIAAADAISRAGELDVNADAVSAARPALDAPLSFASVEAFDLDGLSARNAALNEAIQAERDKRAAAAEAERAVEQIRQPDIGSKESGNSGEGGRGYFGYEVRVDSSLSDYQGYPAGGNVVYVSAATMDGSAKGRFVILHEIGHARLSQCYPDGPQGGGVYGNALTKAAIEAGYSGREVALRGNEAGADLWAYAHGAVSEFSPYPSAAPGIADMVARCS